MSDLTDRLSRHADLHEHQPWADDEQMQFARDLREAVGLIAELARLRAVEPWDRGVFKGVDGLRKLLDSQPYWDEQSHGTRLYFGPNINDYLHRDVLRAAVEYLERAAPPAQPAEQQAQTVCKRTLVEIDARLRECSIVGASAADAYDTFYQHMVETALAAQPAEPVQLTEVEIFKAYTTATGKVLPNMGSSRAELVAITRIIERAHGITGAKK